VKDQDVFINGQVSSVREPDEGVVGIGVFTVKENREGRIGTRKSVFDVNVNGTRPSNT
jgi:hypothetical protein